jgi:hypothetical protein
MRKVSAMRDWAWSSAGARIMGEPRIALGFNSWAARQLQGISVLRALDMFILNIGLLDEQQKAGP